MAAFSSNKLDLVPLLNDLAVFFQVILILELLTWSSLHVVVQVLDDLLNLCSDEYHANKSFAEDLTEGKFSFPIVWAISKDREPIVSDSEPVVSSSCR